MNEPAGRFPRLSAGQLRSARRLLQRKERALERRFLAEGRQAVREALETPFVERLIVSAHDLDQHADLLGLAAARGIEIWAASKQEVAGLSDTVTPQGLLAMCRSVDVDLAVALRGRPKLVVVCAEVRDPGNCGTVIRCADAFGADCVVLTAGSVELGNPKTVRASVGSIFHLPIVVGADLGETVGALRGRGMQVLAADGGGDLLTEVDLRRPTCWVLGNEAWGLPAGIRERCDRTVGIPMWGKAESLNLSTAAAVALFTTAAAQRSA